MTSNAPDVGRLLSTIEWALSKGLPSSDLVPMLRGLRREAPANTPEAHFATRKLAELVMEANPWEAARLARELVKQAPDERAWALYGLAQTLLGHFRVAARAYRQALAIAPDFPHCAHNLGHLMDVGLDRPRDALVYLEKAYRACPDEPEVASSFAHALLRTGHAARARTVLVAALPDADVDTLLERWSRNPLALPTAETPATD